MSTQTIARKRMSAEEAKSFSRYSAHNAARVESSLPCGCEAYKDVFTYGRWQALGFQVQRGQKAVKIPTISTKTVETDDGEERTIRLLHTSAVFCRHQVAPIGKKPATMTAKAAVSEIQALTVDDIPSQASPSLGAPTRETTWEVVHANCRPDYCEDRQSAQLTDQCKGYQRIHKAFTLFQETGKLPRMDARSNHKWGAGTYGLPSWGVAVAGWGAEAQQMVTEWISRGPWEEEDYAGSIEIRTVSEEEYLTREAAHRTIAA